MSAPAPFRADLAEGPDGGAAHWLVAEDGVRSRAVVWPGGDRGTVFTCPGRTEAAEKYGRVARDLVARGWTTTAIDWRGQGFADRLLADARIGHVAAFADYQRDLAAWLRLAEAEGWPRPWVMLAHSMGGCIALRTLAGAHPFAAVAFSAPMWGLLMDPRLRRVAETLPRLASRLGLGARIAPTTAPATYFLEAAFEGNLLTTDRDHWDYMVRQGKGEAAFRLGGPSLAWLAAAMAETRALAALPRPALPAHATVGELEKIVDPAAVRRIMADWPGGTFAEAPAAEHEILMEREPVRAAFLDRALALFDAARDGYSGGPSRQGRSTA